MQGRKIYNRWSRFIETLRKKCASFGDGIVLALAEEEMKIRREELLKQVRTSSQHE